MSDRTRVIVLSQLVELAASIFDVERSAESDDIAADLPFIFEVTKDYMPKASNAIHRTRRHRFGVQSQFVFTR
jgi:hypothetical protein